VDVACTGPARRVAENRGGRTRTRTVHGCYGWRLAQPDSQRAREACGPPRARVSTRLAISTAHSHRRMFTQATRALARRHDRWPDGPAHASPARTQAARRVPHRHDPRHVTPARGAAPRRAARVPMRLCGHAQPHSQAQLTGRARRKPTRRRAITAAVVADGTATRLSSREVTTLTEAAEPREGEHQQPGAAPVRAFQQRTGTAHARR
jgi:hypothetical protein